ncbi:MAG: hypothetical protein GXY17_09735 [Clostridiaceae bacterium]|nr:hypothetical protein [Clostridiaceae bacterium]
MKKLAALLISIMIVACSVLPVAGIGIYLSSDKGDKIRILEDMDIDSPVNGNAIAVLGNVTVNSKVNGHIITVFGEATVNSEVAGQVVTVFGRTYLKESASVMGDVITIGSLERASGAEIAGLEVRVLGESMNLDIGAISYFRLIVMLLFNFAVLVVGMLALLISKSTYRSISKKLDKHFGRKILLGILALIGVTALLLLLIVTLIAPILYILLLILATVPACMFFGRLILKAFSPKNSIMVEFITGLISTTLVKLILIFVVPQESILLGFILVGVLDIFMYAVGLGIHVERHYLKNNENTVTN